MDKLKLAHDYAMELVASPDYNDDMSLVDFVAHVWKYADAMQAEADERESKERPDVLCEVDWSQAPESANVYFKDGDNDTPKWFDRNNKLIGTAPDFGFSGYVCEYRPQ